MIQKPDKERKEKKERQEKKLQAKISDEYRGKNWQQNTTSQIKPHIKRITHYDQVGFVPVIQE